VETHLIPLVLQVASGTRDVVQVFGDDWPTPDGTCVRDYIHVEDLATAHVNALGYLRDGGKSLIANCGYGHGYSVREVVSSVEKIAGLKLEVREEPRRAGDPPALIARADKVRQVLGWTPRLDDIDVIVRSSLEWERRLQREPW
jgi:UDP-glucose 4-epimerase